MVVTWRAPIQRWSIISKKEYCPAELGMFASDLEAVSFHGVHEHIHVFHFDMLYEGDTGR